MKSEGQLGSFKDENEKLKRQIFMIDKARTELESKLIDTEDCSERLRKESERYRKKYNETKQNLDKACNEMEQFGRVIDALEGKMKLMEQERD